MNHDQATSLRSLVSDVSATEIAASVEVANIPILLMVLHQLTGDQRWLEPPYQPSRSRGLDMNDSGGLAPDLQGEIREAASQAILEWADGSPARVPAPQGEYLARMLSVCVGEDVAVEYAGLLAQEMGFLTYQPPKVALRTNTAEMAPLRVVIVGAGVSGIATAIKLRQAGMECVILEKNPAVGGTWYENRYPGVGVDTPSYLYSFSFFSHQWSTYFGRGEEVHEYLQEVVDEFDLYPCIRFGCEVTSARYNEERQRWTIAYVDSDGEHRQEEASIFVTAVGLLSTPKIPDVPGLDEYAGRLFHSARWPDDLELSGKRVAVVGTGASAMQVVPNTVDDVDQLFVIQRSPQWIAPNEDVFEEVDPRVHWLMENVPFYRSWFRAILWWSFGDRIHDSLRIDPEWEHPERSVNRTNDGHRAFFTDYLREKLSGRPDLLEKSLPDYPPFGKRMLLDNGWYDALLKDNCTLIDSPVSKLSSTELHTEDGTSIEVDVVVMATGFQAQRLLAPMDIIGRDGVSIRDVWAQDDPSAYLGMTVPGFPNMFVMYGPNTNLGHGGSYIFLAEAQARYTTDLIAQMAERGIGTVECRQDVHDEYNRRMDEEHANLIWSHQGMDTWYRNSKGRVVTNSPWRLVDYWNMTRSADLDDYLTEPTRNPVRPDAFDV